MTLHPLLFWDQISKNSNFVRDNIFRESFVHLTWGAGDVSTIFVNFVYNWKCPLSNAYRIGPKDPSNQKKVRNIQFYPIYQEL